MFRETPSERLAPRVAEAPLTEAVPEWQDIPPEKFSSGYEDLQAATDISVCLGDFGHGTFPSLHMILILVGQSVPAY